MDPHRTALETVDGLLARARSMPLSAADCLRLAEFAGVVPGRARAAAAALGAQRDGPAVDALRLLSAAIPGVVEGLYQAMRHGVSRRRLDGTAAPRTCTVDFRSSRASEFPRLLARAQAVFPRELEHLLVAGHDHWRVGITEGHGTLAGRTSALAADLQWLHRRLGRLRGTRLWLNGWCLAEDGASPVSAAVQSHLLQAWLAWAATQTHTVAAPEVAAPRTDR